MQIPHSARELHQRGAARKRRTSSQFFQQMVDFKEAKETRLNQLRGEKEREEQSKLGKRTRVFSNDNVDAKLSRKSDLDAFFRRLSKENLQKQRTGALKQK